MSKLKTIKRISKYSVIDFPIWGWIACILLVTLLKDQIINMIGILLPLAMITAIIFYFSKQRSNAKKVIIFILYFFTISHF